jgi:hypothetical protein
LYRTGINEKKNSSISFRKFNIHKQFRISTNGIFAVSEKKEFYLLIKKWKVGGEKNIMNVCVFEILFKSYVNKKNIYERNLYKTTKSMSL